MAKILEFNTETMPNLFSGQSIMENRQSFSEYSNKDYKSEVTIVVQMYNDLEKAKRCVESILKYSTDVDFDLILMIDGSNDGLFDYFKNIEYEHTTIIHNTANKGVGAAWNFVSMDMFSEYIDVVMGDMVVTEHWLSNLLTCIKSDPKIGMVVPVSHNVSNCQWVNLQFNSYDEMQKKAAIYNVSDPRKWVERLRTIAVCPLISKAALYAIGIPYSDIGFSHNFSDDDQSFRIRRMGYKLIVARDTWVLHDHDRSQVSVEAEKKFNDNIAIGRADFQQKYFGIDAWDDVNDFILYDKLIENTSSEVPEILGIDTHCGTQILEVKNAIRAYDKFNAECYAITEEGKYFVDLQSICGASNVVCGNVLSSLDKFEKGSIDYIIIGKFINQYTNLFDLIYKCSNLLKKDGHLYVYFKNPFDILAYLKFLGYIDYNNKNTVLNYTIYQFISEIMNMGLNANLIYNQHYGENELGAGIINLAKNKLEISANKEENLKNLTDLMMCEYHVVDIFYQK